MFVLLAFLAVASAAPHYGYHRNEERGLGWSQPQSNSEMDLFSGQIFDAHQFWKELADEMHRMDEMLNEFSKHFPTTPSNEGVEDDQYHVTITLTGFDEKDIAVNAREGVLMIQAVHNTEGSNERSYIDLRNLPSYVNVNGTWTYDKGVLKITFPLKERPKEIDDVTEEAIITTEASETERSREEMEPVNGDETIDADVGTGRGDSDRERELLTNSIYPYRTVEATTYSVDLKNDVEFVPMKINKN